MNSPSRLFKTFLLVLGILSASATTKAADTLSTVFRPRIGLGTGTIGYYGEIQNYQKSFTPTVNRIGGLIYMNAPFTRFFNVEFMASYGKTASNERTLTRNLNFESRIRAASVNLYYNFWPLLNYNKSRFHPFIGIGISSFEFLSKTDLYDADGNMYHYWSDGSIRDMDESNPLAATDANYLTRDYTYETDLRALDADGLGKYRESSIGFPFSFGAEWHLSPRWDFRIATTWTLTLTDLIDNISPAGTGTRLGDKSNDRLLFTYVSLSYDLVLPNKDDGGDGEPGIDYFAEWDSFDWDKDGVIDALDDCPGTPLEALVDTSGCPLDGDEDGVPDYLDDELNTPPGSYVDQYGVTITEEQFARHLRLYYDSTGYEQEFTEIRTVVNIGKPDKSSRKDPLKAIEGKNYVIVVGKSHKDVTANDLHKFLGFADFKTIIRNDTVYYVMGEYKSIQDAVAAKSELEKIGVDVENISTNNENNQIIKEVDNKVISKVENVNKEENVEAPSLVLEETLYMVQIGAFKKNVDIDEAFPGVENIFFATGKDGITRYYSGKYTNSTEANAQKSKLNKSGFPKAFVVAYKKGERISLVKAGVDEKDLPPNYNEEEEIKDFVDENPFDNTPKDTTTVSTPVDTSGTDNPNMINGVDMSKVKYRILLGRYKGEVPKEELNILMSIGGIKAVKDLDGNNNYYSRQFNTEEERNNAIEEYKSYELGTLEPVVEYNGKFYTPEEFKVLLGQ